MQELNIILSFIQQTPIEYLLYQTIDAPRGRFFLRHLVWLTVVAQAEFIELITNEGSTACVFLCIVS